MERFGCKMENKSSSIRNSKTTLTIGNMQCQSCVRRIEGALMRLPGVTEALADLAEHKASITFDAAKTNEDQFKAAIETEGYRILDDKKEETINRYCSQPIDWFSSPRAYLYGVTAALAIIGIYLGMNTLTSDWYFARVQFGEYRWWIIPLAIGLGVQLALFTLFRANLRGHRLKGVKSSLAASGGVSTAAMMACCSHYLATVIPVLGIPFLSASTVSALAEYQVYFFLAGVISCLLGIGLMLRMMNQHGMIRLENLKNILKITLQQAAGNLPRKEF
jgi:cation transport ATPase